MKEPSSSSRFTAQTTEQARALFDLHLQKYVMFFAGQAHSVNDVAKHLEEKPNTAYVKVKRLEQLNLLYVAETRKRKGKAVKLYKAVAESFFVPFKLLEAETLEALAIPVYTAIEQTLAKQLVHAQRDYLPKGFGYHIRQTQQGTTEVYSALPSGAVPDVKHGDYPAVFDLCSTDLRLSLQDAKALQRELFSLLQTYQDKSGSQSYVLRIGLAPLHS
jgi:predicted transcriptional regulator